ncbi:tubulin-tyrosine ligase family-domain-containing protein [Cokeromyces recurvatus]|uniref:tubulin-tyrosine ligase family-domain-containing protein n=1 Tax=Cokeromyces recurvatus TaxID=90255 RepID=UPI0022204BAA|nr:tubulin-tyrosine ligase family-domain-containing protein [Cokeromyces recurvatus]KAI7904716.1 tubulin-tyrosine ligase family-domain-containing protein [Cokeromyces recurvatus]
MSSAFESFVAVHKYQLSSIPEELWQSLFMKLGEDYLDAGNFVELHHGDPMEGYTLHVKADKTIKKHSEIFLVDHAWTTSPETAKEELRLNPSLMDRLENLMNIDPIDAPVDSDDEEDDEIKPSDELVQLVATQANVSEKEAREALIAENNEVVNAIMHLTIDPEAKAEADRLQDQVMGQMLASGKPQEKEDKENRERLKRREEREKTWINQRVEQIYEKMWSYLQTYTYSILQQDGQPISQTAWYITDEVGSAICHSSDPNVICLPFIFSRGASGMIPYSVIFPIKDIGPGEIITCDILPKSIQRESDKLAYLFAFEDRVLLDNGIQSKRNELIDLFKAKQEKLKNQTFTSVESLKYLSAEKVLETLKKEGEDKAKAEKIVVYTDTTFIQQYLKLDNVKFTDDPIKADIIWTSNMFESWDSLKSQQIINRIPNEECITFKNKLNELIYNTFGLPDWYLPTYNITTQLSEFVGDFLSKEDEVNTNIWITKPWSMSSSSSLDVTKNLSKIIRQYDNPVPRIAQQYLTSPCLYNGKKFGLHYFVLVYRTEPHLVACVYNMFLVRLANKKYSIENLDDHESQLTTMNQMTQLDCKSFIHNVEKQHNFKWDFIQRDINTVIKNILIAATNTSQPLGSLTENNTSKLNTFSVYGVDIILTNTFKPIITGVNSSPDCIKACEYDSEFVNDIFSVIDGRFGNIEKSLSKFTPL